jgi:hypothetical protein
MADKKKEVPEHISKFKKLDKKADQMIATTNKHHRNAYDAAVEKVLMPEGSVDYELLDKMENRDKFADEMSDFYISKAKQHFKVGKDAKFDNLEEQLLMSSYAGITKGELREYTRKLGKKFTFEQFDQGLKPGMMEKINRDLDKATKSHFKDEHIGDIVKYVKGDKFLDANKMNLDEAFKAIKEFKKNGGALKQDDYKQEIFYKKPEKK